MITVPYMHGHLHTSCVCEECQAQVPKQPLHVRVFLETGAVPEGLDSGKLGSIVKQTRHSTCIQNIHTFHCQGLTNTATHTPCR